MHRPVSGQGTVRQRLRRSCRVCTLDTRSLSCPSPTVVVRRAMVSGLISCLPNRRMFSRRLRPVCMCHQPRVFCLLVLEPANSSLFANGHITPKIGGATFRSSPIPLVVNTSHTVLEWLALRGAARTVGAGHLPILLPLSERRDRAPHTNRCATVPRYVVERED